MKQNCIEKAKHIRLLILDVDGILTNGLIYYSDSGSEIRSFHVHDGLGIKLLQRANIQVAIISGKTSKGVMSRLNDLQISHVYLGQENKLPAYNELKTKLNLQVHEIAYMGDDLPDLPLLKQSGLAITVPNAPEEIQRSCDIVTINKGGKGAVREICNFLINIQGHQELVLQSYLTTADDRKHAT